MTDKTDLRAIPPKLTDEQMERARWLMRQLGAVDIRWLPRAKAVVLHFEDRAKLETLSAEYDNDPRRREQVVGFFCRMMGTVVDDVRLSGIFRTEGEVLQED